MKLDIQALSRALVKSMTTIARTPDLYRDHNIQNAADLEVDKMLKDYVKEVGEEPAHDNDVKITKENE